MARILVVEDSTIQHMIVYALKHEGHEVLGASSGDEALQVLKDDAQFNLILTDLMMRGGGTGFIRQLKETYPIIPIILMSAYINRYGSEEAAKLSTACLTKPFVVKDLVHLVRQTLQNQTT